ncbi:adenylate/guanylate cyclase domain-containing protein [Nocardioides abyssi]|uniref:Adenylate/guanylate cyclase domain-containing protein n=1 Tax=Nocardioides abyssi TaxID=3058370 RepID=A0ABT8ET31_9ACTN|nr:adenylate/guanylate cyclase domain-containing protein [Nocardioides abyssi]MDN4161285.1 adenylate/guanylate cyclase domain-containing protein [Nocardioides abyssi]
MADGAGGDRLDLTGAVEAVERFLLEEAPSLTRDDVLAQAGVDEAVAVELWRWLGFPQADHDDVAFTPLDVASLRQAVELVELGVLTDERQAALVRTWGRSFARLAEWQTTLLADVALEEGVDDPVARVAELATEVLPRVEALQSYVWRRHLVSAAGRLLAVDSPGSPAARLAVVFVDIVGYTSRSKSLDQAGLVGWLEGFESVCTDIAVEHGGRVIKNIGDEVLLVADDAEAAAAIALEMVDRGADDDDPFPQVRAGMAYGEVVSRLGDVFGPTVNIAARLTSLARPSTVLVDRGAFEALSGRSGTDDPEDGDGGDDRDARDAGASGDADEAAYRFRRVRRTSVKGYSRLQPWVLRRR